VRKLLSRKLWVTILGTLLGAFKPELIPILKILIPSYVVAQGAVDVATNIKEGRLIS